ncbi:MAG: carboxymuconolactone decarboxylase family protein [Geminicoccaceae bacterium]|nr:carboxymuconolactone decarboxylase family protein [Geminicoccaceae bacterium]
MSRFDYHRSAPELFEQLMTMTRRLRAGALDRRLLELVYVRCSQLNGCAYCLDNHAEAARAAGERQQRLDVLAAWRDAPFFDERERAALALAEALTRVADGGVPEPVWSDARRHFDDRALAELLFAIATINAWNRLSIAVAAEAPARS